MSPFAERLREAAERTAVRAVYSTRPFARG